MKAENTCKLIQTLAGLEDFWSQEIIELAKKSDIELDELVKLVEGYQSPENQRLIELGKAAEKAFELDGAVSVYETDGEICFVRHKETAYELLEWYREQEAE